MRQVHFVLSVLMGLTSSTVQAQDHLYTPMKKDFTENGVPFIVEMTNENSEEAIRSEMVDKSENPQKTAEQTAEDSKFSQTTDDDTPVTREEIAVEKNITTSRPWKAPDFSGQESTLGYGPQVFAIPKGLEPNVKFWIDVYSKYTTDQGVLHDSDYIDLVYEEMNFASTSARTDLNIYKKEALKIREVKESKKRIIAMLEKLDKTTDPSGLSPQERKVWDYFEKINEPRKFANAAKKNRVRFQLGQKDRMIQGIYFSGRYIEDFEKIFREAGLPIELVRLPFVESSYNVLARSKVGASGLWQIMPYTMKGFMKKDPAVDLRNHPIEATRLAAKLLRINYGMLQSWPLALTGYNHGPSGVSRITKKFKSREIGELVKANRFGFASRNFYASFLAALEVTSNATKYLGPVNWSQPLDSADIKLPIAIKYHDLMRWFDGDDLKTQVFNPHVTRLARSRGRPIPKGMIVSISKKKLDSVMRELQSPDHLKRAQLLAVAEGRMPALEQETVPIPYIVRKRDNLRKIAAQFGVTEEEIRQANALPRKVKLRVGQRIQIP